MTTELVIVFVVLGLTTLSLASYRLFVMRVKGDDCLHLLDADAPLVARQQAAARKLEAIDQWGKILTVFTGIAGIAAYAVWWLQA